MAIYGDYRIFSHEPNEQQTRQTLMRLGKRMASYLKRRGKKPVNFKFDHIIKDSTIIEPRWTVGLKATENKLALREQ